MCTNVLQYFENMDENIEQGGVIALVYVTTGAKTLPPPVLCCQSIVVTLLGAQNVPLSFRLHWLHIQHGRKVIRGEEKFILYNFHNLQKITQ